MERLQMSRLRILNDNIIEGLRRAVKDTGQRDTPISATDQSSIEGLEEI